MKKIVILLCFFGLLLPKSNAQNEIRFGFQFSPTLSWMKTDAKRINNNGSLILGAKLGAVGEYYFRENYSIASGIGFAFNHSGRLKYEDGGVIWAKSDLSVPGLDTIQSGVSLKYNLQYVEIPISLKLRSGYFGTFRFFTELPMLYLGFRTQARGSTKGNTKTVIDGNGNVQTVEIDIEKENISPDVAFFNLSWGLGGGVEYELGSKTSLVGGLYYQQGFTDVTKDSGFTIVNGQRKDEKSKATIGAFIIRLGVMF